MSLFQRNLVRASGWILPLLSVLAIGILTPGCGGDEAPSPTVPAPPPPPSTPEPEAPSPGVPTNLRFSASGADFIEWSWGAVEGVDGYRVQFSENEAFTEADDIVLRTAKQLSYRREGLPPDASAYLRVQSLVRVDGEEVMSEWSQHVPGMAIPPPGVPMNLRITASGRDFIEWSWDAVERADGYSVQFSEDEAFTDADDIILRTAEQLSYRREGLEPETAAYLRAQSLIRMGEATVTSDWSADVTGTAAPPLPGLVVTPEELTVMEGENAAFTLRLTTQPTAPVTVAVSVQARKQDLNTERPAVRISRGGRLTFDAQTWNVEQVVRMVGEQDSDDFDEEVTIYVDTTSDDPDYENLPRRILLADVIDDDPYGLGIEKIGFFIGSPPLGETRTYGVALDGMPCGDVILTTTSSDLDLITVSAGSILFFTPDNFDVPQPFRLTNVGARSRWDSVVIRQEAQGGCYDGVFEDFFLLPRHFQRYPDDDPRNSEPIEVSDEDVTMTEGGTARFAVRLTRAPADDVIVWIQGYAPDVLEIHGQAEGETCFGYECTAISFIDLRFTPEDWEHEQEVVLTAHHDDDTRDESMTLLLWPQTDDPDFDARPFGSRTVIPVTVYDDDRR